MEIYLQHLYNIFKNSEELAEFLSKDIIAATDTKDMGDLV